MSSVEGLPASLMPWTSQDCAENLLKSPSESEIRVPDVVLRTATETSAAGTLSLNRSRNSLSWLLNSNAKGGLTDITNVSSPARSAHAGKSLTCGSKPAFLLPLSSITGVSGTDTAELIIELNEGTIVAFRLHNNGKVNDKRLSWVSTAPNLVAQLLSRVQDSEITHVVTPGISTSSMENSHQWANDEQIALLFSEDSKTPYKSPLPQEKSPTKSIPTPELRLERQEPMPEGLIEQTSGEHSPQPSASELHKEKIRSYVRVLAKGNDSSAASKEFYQETGYFLGAFESGSANLTAKAAKRQLLTSLIPVLEEMEADRKREQQMIEDETGVIWKDDERTKDYIYIDSITGRKIPNAEYEKRYRNYLRRRKLVRSHAFISGSPLSQNPSTMATSKAASQQVEEPFGGMGPSPPRVHSLEPDFKSTAVDPSISRPSSSTPPFRSIEEPKAKASVCTPEEPQPHNPEVPHDVSHKSSPRALAESEDVSNKGALDSSTQTQSEHEESTFCSSTSFISVLIDDMHREVASLQPISASTTSRINDTLEAFEMEVKGCEEDLWAIWELTLRAFQRKVGDMQRDVVRNIHQLVDEERRTTIPSPIKEEEFLDTMETDDQSTDLTEAPSRSAGQLDSDSSLRLQAIPVESSDEPAGESFLMPTEEFARRRKKKASRRLSVSTDVRVISQQMTEDLDQQDSDA